MVGAPDPRVLRRMMGALKHRGPDGEGTSCDERAALGHVRLAVIDPVGSPQPIADEDSRLHLIVNGEIYNYRDLRRDLTARGHRFATGGDSETILHLYQERGEGCVEALLGMFAFALWDARADRLVLARDRLGIKPLFYAETADGLVFASELKAVLVHPAVRKEIDPEALDLYLTFRYVPGPRTIVRGVFKLPPGHTLVYAGGRLTLRRYWGVPPTDGGAGPRGRKRSDAEVVDRLRGLLSESVRARLVSDVPLGAYLSGGLDSSLIVSLMSCAAASPIKTFSVGFREEGFDESAAAEKVARHCRTDHRQLVCEREASLAELPRILWHLDEPVADAAAIPTFQMARVTKEHATVVLTGEGADELFAGYSHYRFQVWTDAAARLLRPLGLLGGAARWARFARGLNDPTAAWLALRSVFTEEERRALLLPERCCAGEGPAEALVADHVGRTRRADLLSRLLAFDLRTWLPDDLLVKVDRMTMAHAVEARVPFLDHRLVEYMAGVPSRLKIQGARSKPLLRAVARPLLPPSTVRRRKRGFAVPVGRWLHDGALAAALLGRESIERRGLFRFEAVEPLVRRRRHTFFSRRQLWTLITLEIWCRAMLDADPAAPPASGGAQALHTILAQPEEVAPYRQRSGR